MGEKKSEKRIKKENYWKRLQDLSLKFDKAIIVNMNDVSSKQVQKIRYNLRPLKAEMIMGKNVSSIYQTQSY
jgi:ribosomal protein L10